MKACRFPRNSSLTAYRYGCRCARCREAESKSRTGPIDIRDSCVEWEGNRQWRRGYGRITVDGVQWLAHRWTWTQTYGPIPEGLCVLHLCDNPPCVNLDHLVLGTHRANMLHREASRSRIKEVAS